MCLTPINVINPFRINKVANVRYRYFAYYGGIAKEVSFKQYLIAQKNGQRVSKIEQGFTLSGEFKDLEFIDTESQYIQVPCGKCPECKRVSANDWVIRTNAECQVFEGKDRVSFVTFTYAPEHLRVNDKGDGILHSQDLQNLFKRFRQAVDEFYNPMYVRNGQVRSKVAVPLYASEKAELEEKPSGWLYPCGYHSRSSKLIRYEKPDIKILWCSEYGSKSNRPHYHAIIIGVPYNITSQLLHCFRPNHPNKLWYQGRCIVERPRNREAIGQYLAKYATKVNGQIMFSDADLLDALETKERVDIFKKMVSIPDGAPKQTRHRSNHLGENQYLLNMVHLVSRTTPNSTDPYLLQEFDRKYIEEFGYIAEMYVDLGSYKDKDGKVCTQHRPLPKSLKPYVFANYIRCAEHPDDNILNYQINNRTYVFRQQNYTQNLLNDAIREQEENGFEESDYSQLADMSDGLQSLSALLCSGEVNRIKSSIQSTFKDLCKDKSSTF